jgi:hypothetical protein
MFVHLSQAIYKGWKQTTFMSVFEQQGKYSLVCQLQQPLQVVGGHDIVPGDGKKFC